MRFSFEHSMQEEVKNIILKLNQGRGHDNIPTKLSLDCADEVTAFLAQIFNNLISTGTYPNILKNHKVTPLPKEVAVLPVINNILERILYNQMSLYQYNNLLSDFQYGFRKGCGTDSAISSQQISGKNSENKLKLP